jgi:integrase
MWQRFMARLLKDTKISERFTEHDLRGKAGSDAESLERAQQLLGHADSKITAKTYRRKPQLVKPLR